MIGLAYFVGVDLGSDRICTDHTVLVKIGAAGLVDYIDLVGVQDCFVLLDFVPGNTLVAVGLSKDLGLGVLC